MTDYKDWLCDNRYVDKNGVVLSDAEHYQIYLFGSETDIEDFEWEDEHPGWVVGDDFEQPPTFSPAAWEWRTGRKFKEEYRRLPEFFPPDQGQRRKRINDYLVRPLKRVERAF